MFRDVSSITKAPEMLGGRVKTLHPAVHGGMSCQPESVLTPRYPIPRDRFRPRRLGNQQHLTHHPSHLQPLPVRPPNIQARLYTRISNRRNRYRRCHATTSGRQEPRSGIHHFLSGRLRFGLGGMEKEWQSIRRDQARISAQGV